MHIDRRATDRMYAGVLGIWAALLLVGLVGLVLMVTGTISQTAAVGPLVFVLVCVPNLVIYAWIWRATRRLGTALVITPQGLTCRTPRGAVTLPWAQIREIGVVSSFRQRQLAVLPATDVGPGSPGVESTLSRGGWSTVRKAGLRLSFRVIAEPAVEVVAAITELSDGRFSPSLPAAGRVADAG